MRPKEILGDLNTTRLRHVSPCGLLSALRGAWGVCVHNRAANRPIRDERVWMEPIKDGPSRRPLPHRQRQPGTGAEEDQWPLIMDKEHLNTTPTTHSQDYHRCYCPVWSHICFFQIKVACLRSGAFAKTDKNSCKQRQLRARIVQSPLEQKSNVANELTILKGPQVKTQRQSRAFCFGCLKEIFPELSGTEWSLVWGIQSLKNVAHQIAPKIQTFFNMRQ